MTIIDHIKQKIFDKNINTPDFWDQQFKEEYEYMVGNVPSGYLRWVPYRFEMVVQHLNNPKASVLDVGCGLGHLVRYIYARYPLAQITGCDFSPYAVQKTKDLGSKAFVSDCYSFASKLNVPVDCVVGTEIIEHLSHPKKFLKECYYALKDGGKVIITTPIIGRLSESHDHVKEFTMDELKTLMQKVFENVEVFDYQGFQLAVGYKEKYVV